MVRKQLYIEERQEQALKARARELGVTEAEIVREALDRMLSDPAPSLSQTMQAARARLVAELDAVLDADAHEFQAQPGYRFRREDAYDEPRFTRWDYGQDDQRSER